MKHARSKYASLSLMSTILTGAFTSIHHVYEIGSLAIVLVLLFVVTPALLMRWFRNTENRISLLAYGFLTAWLVVGLGVVDGLWNHILRPLSLQFHALVAFHGGGTTAVAATVERHLLHEVTGILTFVASSFAAYYGYKFIRMSRQSEGAVTTMIHENKQ